MCMQCYDLGTMGTPHAIRAAGEELAQDSVRAGTVRTARPLWCVCCVTFQQPLAPGHCGASVVSGSESQSVVDDVEA